MKQAAGVKKLLFCGVGCQVQGIIYDTILQFLLSIFSVVTYTIVMQSNFLKCSITICGAPLKFGQALCARNKLRSVKALLYHSIFTIKISISSTAESL